MRQHLSRESLSKILRNSNIEDLSYYELAELIRSEQGVSDNIPESTCQVDPRNGERILYSLVRSRRPHDNHHDPSSSLSVSDGSDLSSRYKEHCVICEGETTGVVDVVDLSEGFTLINMNLYPVLYPSGDSSLPALSPNAPFPGPEGIPAAGLHLLQWTSSFHDTDWHNMPQTDRFIAMQRLAALEKQLLTTSDGIMPEVKSGSDRAGCFGYVSIIKNSGCQVGASLAHGHQQIAFSNIMPNRIAQNLCFERERGETFCAYLLRENPPLLMVHDYGPAVLIVPYFMRRPFNMMLLFKDVSKGYIHELTSSELKAAADSWHDAICVFNKVLPSIGREIAFNIITHNGPGAGLYFEFLPYTQETGGYEHLGLAICQSDPFNAANQIRGIMQKL